MKKFVFLLVALFSFSVVFAQDISYGLKAGIDYGGGLTSDEEYNELFKPTVSFNVGAFVEFGLGEFFALQPEVNFLGTTFKGTDEDKPFQGLTVHNTVGGSRNFIQVPVMVKYFFTDGLSLEAGPYVSFLMTAKYDGDKKVYQGDVLLPEPYSEYFTNDDVKERFANVDYGLAVGATYGLDNGLLFSLRYNLGLANQAQENFGIGEADGDIYGSKDYSIQNRIFQFTVGYKFM